MQTDYHWQCVRRQKQVYTSIVELTQLSSVGSGAMNRAV